LGAEYEAMVYEAVVGVETQSGGPMVSE